MKKSAIRKILLLFALMFVLSFVIAVIDNGWAALSSYELGRATGIIFKQFVKVFLNLCLILIVIRQLKKNKS